MTLLQKRDAQRLSERSRLFDRTRTELREVLSEVLPDSRVVLFGSLTQRGVFHSNSDIDLALFSDPAGGSIFDLVSEIGSRMRRPVDIVLLEKTRLKNKILREGEVWTT